MRLVRAARFQIRISLRERARSHHRSCIRGTAQHHHGGTAPTCQNWPPGTSNRYSRVTSSRCLPHRPTPRESNALPTSSRQPDATPTHTQQPSSQSFAAPTALSAGVIPPRTGSIGTPPRCSTESPRRSSPRLLHVGSRFLTPSAAPVPSSSRQPSEVISPSVLTSIHLRGLSPASRPRGSMSNLFPLVPLRSHAPNRRRAPLPTLTSSPPIGSSPTPAVR